MDTTLSHRKNPAVGWNILASAKADKGEKISRAQISVNGFNKYDQSFNTPISQWQHELSQQGQFPGNNTSELTITTDKGEVTANQDSWSDIDPSGD
ncbi:MAG TPA: hypothetical protein VMH85_07305 [Terriglobales bacterium]|nr:hypothetical protein [Terriglobales bacterium]